MLCLTLSVLGGVNVKGVWVQQIWANVPDPLCSRVVSMVHGDIGDTA